MYKALIVGQEPEQCRVYCDCGLKYRSEEHWSYIENGMPEYLRNKAQMLGLLAGFTDAFQKHKYLCPYCNVKQKLLDPYTKYTKKQVISFADMVHSKVNSSMTKEKIISVIKEDLNM